MAQELAFDDGVRIHDTTLLANGLAFPLDRVDYVEVEEGADLTVPFLEFAAAVLLVGFGVALGVVGDDWMWTALLGGVGVLLIIASVVGGVGGAPVYRLVLHAAGSHAVAWLSRDRERVLRVADAIRARCI